MNNHTITSYFMLLNFPLDEELISEISEIAIGEYELENSLEKIEQYWEQSSFILAPYHNKAKNILILVGTEDIQKQVEDHQVSLVTMLGSEHIGSIRKVIFILSH